VTAAAPAGAPGATLDGLPETTTVLVVGGGPVGLVTSLLLAQQGIDHVVVERRTGAQAAPAAHVISARTFEILRSAGVDMAQVLAACAPAEDGAWVRWVTTLVGDELGRVPFERQHQLAALDVVTPTPLRNLSQHRLEAVLRDHVDRLAEGVVWVAGEQSPDGVVSTLRDVRTGRCRTVTSRYVVAADGAGSRIRAALDIPMEGPDVLQDFVMIHAAADLRHLVEDRPATLYWTMEPGFRGVFVAHDLGSTWVFMHEWDPATESFDDYTPARCAGLFRAAAGVDDLDLAIEHVRPWRMSCQIAQRYQEGRIFLVGDAAHRFPPTGGLGLNTGVADAHNLVWKLAAVEHGWAPPGLLDTYGTERRPVARDNADKSLENALGMLDVFAACGATGPQAEQRAAFDAALSTDAGRAAIAAAAEGQGEHFDMLGLQLGFGYDPATGPVLDDGSVPVPVANPVREYAPSTRPGGRLPHAWVERDGDRVSTLDLVAPGRFVLLTGSDAWADAADGLVGGPVPLDVVRVGVDVRDPDGAWSAVSGIGRSGAVLVRPDQHVAWRSAGPRPDPVGTLNAALTALVEV
jgi:2-polyprenyl-6-methoxyphenol hydroxylase-like FAD-dependent oxidoreductase